MERLYGVVKCFSHRVPGSTESCVILLNTLRKRAPWSKKFEIQRVKKKQTDIFTEDFSDLLIHEWKV